MLDFLYLRSIKVNCSWCYSCESGKQPAVKGLARPSPRVLNLKHQSQNHCYYYYYHCYYYYRCYYYYHHHNYHSHYCSCLSGWSSFWVDIQRASCDPQPWASRMFLSNINLAVSSWAAVCRSNISVVTPIWWLDNDFLILFQARQTSSGPHSC